MWVQVMRTGIPDPGLHQGPVQDLVLCPDQGLSLHLSHVLVHHPSQGPGLSPNLDPGLGPDHDHDLKKMNVDLMISEMMKQKKWDLVKRRMKLKMNRNQKAKT